MSRAFSECDAKMMETENVLSVLIRSMCND